MKKIRYNPRGNIIQLSTRTFTEDTITYANLKWHIVSVGDHQNMECGPYHRALYEDKSILARYNRPWSEIKRDTSVCQHCINIFEKILEKKS